MKYRKVIAVIEIIFIHCMVKCQYKQWFVWFVWSSSKSVLPFYNAQLPMHIIIQVQGMKVETACCTQKTVAYKIIIKT